MNYTQQYSCKFGIITESKWNLKLFSKANSSHFSFNQAPGTWYPQRCTSRSPGPLGTPPAHFKSDKTLLLLLFLLSILLLISCGSPDIYLLVGSAPLPSWIRTEWWPRRPSSCTWSTRSAVATTWTSIPPALSPPLKQNIWIYFLSFDMESNLYWQCTL